MKRRIAMKLSVLTFVVCLIVVPAQAKYSGGTGEPNDPYQIATAADLIALGETPADCDKHFILTTDIDLDPKLPGGRVFDKAVIGAFSGVFDGNGHAISHLTIVGGGYLGLIGRLGQWPPRGGLRRVGVIDVSITGSGGSVGGLVGYNNYGTVSECYSTGRVSGAEWWVGGLVGGNSGDVTECFSRATVDGNDFVGGLAGGNGGQVTDCYSTGAVSGSSGIGGLVGVNGANPAVVTACYSVGAVRGGSAAGGLVGINWGFVAPACFWDTQTSGQIQSEGGSGKTTADMQMSATFVAWGAYRPIWTIDDGRDYPRLAWENMPGDLLGAPYGGGSGTGEDPYLIYTAEQLNSIGAHASAWDKHFKLMADIDLSAFDGKDGRPALNMIGYSDPTPEQENFVGTYFNGIPFTGSFDGNDHVISHLTLNVQSRFAGLFDMLGGPGQVRDLGVVDVNITFRSAPCEELGCDVSLGGGLVGYNAMGTVTRCYSSGVVKGDGTAGGLVGYNSGVVTECFSRATVDGNDFVGGLVGGNYGGYFRKGTVGLCYSSGTVSGNDYVGGLVGFNDAGTVTQCYSTGAVSGNSDVGGLVGYSPGWYPVVASFWDTQTSGQATSAEGTGKTTAEMQTQSTFTDAGWDFVGETKNGTADIWWIDEGKDYPRLWWKLTPEK
jgi:hypothetical protein